MESTTKFAIVEVKHMLLDSAVLSLKLLIFDSEFDGLFLEFAVCLWIPLFVIEHE